jgi:GNAT superfamily N-acetyltransferase
LNRVDLGNNSWISIPIAMFESSYLIRCALVEELPLLSDIERSAAQLFVDTPYAFVADDLPLSLDFVVRQFKSGRVWVAVDDRQTIVGYAIAEDIDGAAYLRQIDVEPAFGRRGIGRKLVECVCRWAKEQHYRRILLSTFLDIEWNAPFYAKLGFQILAEDELTPSFQQIRRKEAAAGLPIDRRAIMYLELTSSSS